LVNIDSLERTHILVKNETGEVPNGVAEVTGGLFKVGSLDLVVDQLFVAVFENMFDIAVYAKRKSVSVSCLLPRALEDD
jgi:hypothetical protein